MNKEGGWGGESRGVRSLPGDNLVVDCGEHLWYHLAVFPLWNGSRGARQKTRVGLQQENFIFSLGTWDEK